MSARVVSTRVESAPTPRVKNGSATPGYVGRFIQSWMRRNILKRHKKRKPGCSTLHYYGYQMLDPRSAAHTPKPWSSRKGTSANKCILSFSRRTHFHGAGLQVMECQHYCTTCCRTTNGSEALKSLSRVKEIDDCGALDKCGGSPFHAVKVTRDVEKS